MAEKITVREISNNSTIGLGQLHAKLDLTQSSLPSALNGLPSAVNFTGMIIEYKEVQLVKWKKEIIFKITEGGIETLTVSMWLSHENPRGLQISCAEDILGRIVHVRHVQVQSFDFTNPCELNFYGEIRPSAINMHVILVPIISGAAYVRYTMNKKQLMINDQISIIPKKLVAKAAMTKYPIFTEDYRVLSSAIGTISTLHHCIYNGIRFNQCRNQFQVFINQQIKKANSQSALFRRSKYWVTSYEQQREWEQKCKEKREREELCKRLEGIEL